jgi:hypothetical protein
MSSCLQWTACHTSCLVFPVEMEYAVFKLKRFVLQEFTTAEKVQHMKACEFEQ